MKITFTTYCSKEYAALGDLVLPNRRAYCAKHGYDLVVHDTPISGRGCNWDKLLIILKALETSDVVVWNGVDVVVMNMEFRVESILQQHPKACAIFSADIFGLNSDNMIFRRGPWAEQFLTAVNIVGYSWYRDHPWGEQEGMIRMLHQQPYVDRVAWVEQNVMNSYINSLYGRPSAWPGDYRPGDWLVHLPGLPFDKRIEATKKLLRFAHTPAALGRSSSGAAVAPPAVSHGPVESPAPVLQTPAAVGS